MEPFSPNVQKSFKEKEIGEVPLHYETQTKMGLGGKLRDLRVFKASSIRRMQNNSKCTAWLFNITFSISLNKKKVFEAVMETAQGPFEIHKHRLAMGKLTLSGGTRNDNLLRSLHTNTGQHKQVLYGKLWWLSADLGKCFKFTVGR